jgi:hypothetical protein
VVLSGRYDDSYFWKLPCWLDNLQIAGMAGLVKTHTKTTSKVSARGKTCLFACYSTNHENVCFVIIDPQTKSTVHSIDVLWLNLMYFTSKVGLQELAQAWKYQAH